jgi:hypothetical protein
LRDLPQPQANRPAAHQTRNVALQALIMIKPQARTSHHTRFAVGLFRKFAMQC